MRDEQVQIISSMGDSLKQKGASASLGQVADCRKNSRLLQKSQSGFTLIEIMVVIVIIALMGAIVGPTVFNKVQQAEETRIAQDVRAIESALKMYRLDNYNYPGQAEGLDALMVEPSSARNWRGPYLESVPKDPWDVNYRYAYPGTHGKEVEVFTYGRDNAAGGEGSDADWGSWNIK